MYRDDCSGEDPVKPAAAERAADEVILLLSVVWTFSCSLLEGSWAVVKDKELVAGGDPKREGVVGMMPLRLLVVVLRGRVGILNMFIAAAAFCCSLVSAAAAWAIAAV